MGQLQPFLSGRDLNWIGKMTSSAPEHAAWFELRPCPSCCVLNVTIQWVGTVTF